jgi:hypothetical protein
MYRGFIAALSGEYRASARPGLAYRTSRKPRVRRDIVKRAEAHKVYDEDATQIHMEVGRTRKRCVICSQEADGRQLPRLLRTRGARPYRR